tara:strand:+ start:14142 stop:15602 length:1461 start_codon:yes stop_codon:yes gene_type:complete
MNKPDIFIIITDSARAFFSNSGDDREMPDFYSTLKDFVKCPRAYCSAPSSVMSGGSIISSLDAYMISRNYDNFRFNNAFKINNIENLKSINYDCKGFFVARELREKIGKLVGIDYENLPSQLKFSNRMWSNEDLNRYYNSYLKSNENNKKPLFNIIWNNIRHDHNISKNLDELRSILKEHNRWDNSIIFFLSDHGYPTKDKGITPEGLKRDNKTHDLWLTEDNIRIPFYFKTPYDYDYPINHNVAATDIFPTIFNILGIDFKSPYSSAVSLSSFNKKRSKELKNRSIRVDSRFIGQNQRKTAIIKGFNKLVYNHDLNEFEFFELSDDYNYEKLINSKSREKKSFIEVYNQKEKKALDFQYDSQFSKYSLLNKEIYYGDYDEQLLSYLKENCVKKVDSIDKLSNPINIFKHNILFININFNNNFFYKLILTLFRKNININLVSNQEVLKWNIKRIYLAFKTSIPFLIKEPNYLFVRINEILKIIKKK